MADSEGAVPGGRRPRSVANVPLREPNGLEGHGAERKERKASTSMSAPGAARSLAQHAPFPSEIREVAESDVKAQFKRRPSRGLSDPSARFQPGRVISDRYEIKELIASGGMGRVYLARQIALNRLVAIKILLPQEADPEFRRRFLLEASVSAQLVHRHIVTVHDYGETEDGDLYLAMEYLDGEPLSKAISQALRMPALRTCRISMQICRALRAAHSKGVVHRDLKPRNVMLQRDDEDEDEGGGAGDFVKVLDFGLVKVFETSSQDSGFVDFTRVGMLLGSPKYMAPEQIRSQPVGPWTDVYALGAMMFHMLSGRPPFVGATSPEIMAQHVRAPVPSLQSAAGEGVVIAPELEVIVQRALAKSVDERYLSMDELLADLKAAHRLITGASQESGSFLVPAGDQVVDDLLMATLGPSGFADALSSDFGELALREEGRTILRVEGRAPEAAAVPREPSPTAVVEPERQEVVASPDTARPRTLELTWHFWLLAVLVVLTAILAGLLLGRLRAPTRSERVSVIERVHETHGLDEVETDRSHEWGRTPAEATDARSDRGRGPLGPS